MGNSQKTRKRLYKMRRNLFRPNLFVQRLVVGAANILHVKSPALFVAALPKSGSTALTSYLSEVTGYPTYYWGDSYMSNQSLSASRVADSYWFPHVVHQHCDATQHTLTLLNKRGVRPVFLFRNIFDIAISIADKLENDPWLTPTVVASKDALALPRQERLNMVIDIALPRFIVKYASWWEAHKNGEADVFMLAYEDMVADKAATVERMLDHFGVKVERACIEAAVEAVDASGKTRFNRGVPGRGTELSDAQRRRIEDLAKPFPWVDFSPLGLAPPQADAPTWSRPVTDTDY